MIGKCEDCVYYVPGGPGDVGYGSCHRRAPGPYANVHQMTLKLLADLHAKAFEGGDTDLCGGMEPDSDQPDWTNWPQVDETDGCGEFAAK